MVAKVGSRTTGSILIFDETHEYSRSWAEELFEAGLSARIVSGSQEFREALSSPSSRLALVHAGWSVLVRRAARDCYGHHDRPKIIFVTPNFSAQTVLHLMHAGDLVLPQPLEPGTLVGAIELLTSIAVDSSEFARQYSLSPREAGLLGCAISGMTDDEAAKAFGCSRGTIAKFWTGIFRKTLVSGQRDVLIRLLQARRAGGTLRLSGTRCPKP